MSNALQIIRTAIPDASEGLCDHILWGRTGFPCFGKVDARVIYKAASRYIRAWNKGINLCDFCDRVATENDLCAGCRTALTAASNRISATPSAQTE